MNSWTKVLRIPRTSPILFRCVQSPKKFGWKFWILILQKTEKISAEIWQKLLWKIFFSKQNRKNKRLKNLQLKIFKLKKIVVYHWEKSNKIIWKITENIFLKMKMEKFWQIFLKISEKTAEKWKIALHTTLYWQNAGLNFALNL